MRDLEKKEIDTLKCKPLKNGRPRAYRVADRLYMAITTSGGNDPKRAAGSWTMRYRWGGRGKWMGLAPLNRLTFKDAKKLVYTHGLTLAEGKDPLAVRRDALATAMSAESKRRTFKQAFHEYKDSGALKAFLPRTQTDWTNRVETHVLPVIGRCIVSEITAHDVRKVLQDLWYSKPKTGRQVRQQIEIILRWSAVHGYRDAETPNPAALKNGLIDLLPADAARPVVIKSHAAVPYLEIPAFMARLRATDGPAARCLELIALTASRRREIEKMCWNEVDAATNMMTIPALRMKIKKNGPHDIPMSSRVAAIFAAMPRGADDALVFPQCQSHNVTLDVMHAATGIPKGGPDIHGLRSSFSTWANDAPRKADKDVIESCMHHGLKNKVEASHNRSQHLDARRALLQQWAAFCES